jgi:hypothetical protein
MLTHALAAFALLFPTIPAALAAPALQGVPPAAPAPTTPAVDAVVVPASPNSTCPIMGKPISTRLFTDTKLGRIYICCKACVKDIQADVEHAYRTAYPTTEKLDNKICPVTGKSLEGEAAKKAKRVELQGRDFLVADEAAAASAIQDSQATLAKLADPKLEDLRNTACPVTGDPVGKNVIAVIEGRIVRFASPKAIEDARKDPSKTLARAIEIAEKDAAETNGAKKPAEPKAGPPAKDPKLPVGGR